MQSEPIPFRALALVMSALNVDSAQFHPFEGPKPIAVFIQTDPWAMVMGSDTPRVAVYEDGTVLFLKKHKDALRYHEKKLSGAELLDFRRHLAPVFGLKGWKTFYDLRPNVTDQPETMFFLRDGSRELATRVHGLMTTDTELPAHFVFPSDQKPDVVPKELLELHKRLCSTDYPESKEWHPKYVEVMIWPYEYAPDASIVWPKEWPGIDSQRSMKRGDSYSIFLDGVLLPELRKFLETRQEKGAVEIAGKKWAVSWRLVFPSEPLWRNAFCGAKER